MLFAMIMQTVAVTTYIGHQSKSVHISSDLICNIIIAPRKYSLPIPALQSALCFKKRVEEILSGEMFISGLALSASGKSKLFG